MPVVYDEKDIFPDSEGQYIYVMCANSFHSSTWVDGISNIRLDGENLKITFETFNAGYGHEGATYTLSVIKIKKASLPQGVSKADVEYHETTQEEYIAALFNGESARLLVLPDLLADTGIEEIKIVEGAIAERLASNIQPKTATEEGINISRSRFYDGGVFNEDEAEKYKYILFSYMPDTRDAKVKSLASAELNASKGFMLTFDTEYKECEASDGSCTLFFIKVNREQAVSFGLKTWETEFYFK